MEWIEPKKILIPPDFQRAVGGHPVIAEAIYRRGITSVNDAVAFLDPTKYFPASPFELPGMVQAVERLNGALEREETICIWGDFDVDGQTATALFYSGLRYLTDKVFYHIPVRAIESHGINLPILQKILQPSQIIADDPRWPKGEWSAPNLIVTCDTGISANQAVEYCRELEVDVVITDHHDLPEVLPPATAIVNPKMCPVDHPLRHIPGVGVAFKVVEALFLTNGLIGEIEQYLDLVALGIVADLAIQRKDTRFLLQRGLERCRNTSRVGLEFLIELSEVSLEHLSEEHIGFMLAPRLNALGRLSDANRAVELLTTGDKGRAIALGYELEGLNSRRKLLTSQVYQGALASIQREPSQLDGSALVLYQSDWPAGVIGIVASRLVERFHKPTILITISGDEHARGSARSIEGIDISTAIAGCADLLEGYGGHPMAAGLSIRSERIPEFINCFNRQVELQGTIPIPKINIDLDIPLSDFTDNLAEEIERLSPFGPGNPPLTLVCRDVRIVRYIGVGRENEHLSITIEDLSGVERRVIWWQAGDRSGELPEGWFDLAFTARSTTFRGNKELQLEWIDYSVRESQNEEPGSQFNFELVDCRIEVDPLVRLGKISGGDVQIWAEGDHKRILEEKGHVAHSRYGLEPCSALIVWTIPASIEDAQYVLNKTSPERIYLFALQPTASDFAGFLERLVGVIKYANKNYNGRLDISRIAEITAQREVTVRTGVELLVAKGLIGLEAYNDDEFFITKGGERNQINLDRKTIELQSLLQETKAFRNYYTQMELKQLQIIFAGS